MKTEDRTKIKICGIRRKEDVELMNRLKPDFVGFIIQFPKSFRSLTKEQVKALSEEVDTSIQKVGVFVNEDVETVAGLLEQGVIQTAQLHGQEDESYIRKLRTMTDKKIIKAFSVKTKEDIEKALLSTADYILLDQGGGGTGKTFDWSLVPKIERPWFLAGGLSEENLEEAVMRLKPWAVDLSSAVETDRIKDPVKAENIMRILKNLK